MRVGGAENEHDMLGRLLQRLQQRIERRNREHVNLVDDVDLVATAGRRIIHASDDLLTHVLNTRTACRVKLIYIRMFA